MRLNPALASVATVLSLTSSARATTILRGPFLQAVTTTEATLVFDLSEPAHAEVRIQGVVAGELQLPSTSSERHHEVRITGLEPDQEYRYSVHVEGGEDRYQQVTFRTAVETGSPFSMLLVGDTRSGHGEHAALVAAMQQEDARLIINTGDLVGDGEDDDQWNVFFSIERPLLSRVPLYPVVGNHDTHLGDAANFRDVFALPGDKLYYSFDYSNAHFVVLDGHANTDLLCVKDEQVVLNCFDEPQLQWLETDLSAACERADTKWVFVAVHDGPYSSKDDRYGSSQMRDLLPLLGRYGVTAIFSGHDHYYERGVSDNGIPYVIAGGGGAGLYDIAEPCDFPHTMVTNAQVHHYVSLDVGPDLVRLTAKTADGTVLDETTFDTAKSCGASPPSEQPATAADADGGCHAAPGENPGRYGFLAAAVGMGLAWGARRRRQRLREG